MAHLTALWRYPLKSARGIAVSSARIAHTGLDDDRTWMVVDARGRFVSQRTLPAMARLAAVPTAVGLQLQWPGIEPIEVAIPSFGRSAPVEIWSDRVAAADAGDSAADWLSAVFAVPLRLVWMPPQIVRSVEAVGEGSENYRVGFADGYPLLIASIESLDDLNLRLPQAIEMLRFRPNLVVSGWEAFAEDRIRRLRIGDVYLLLAKPCTRCSIPSLDPWTGESGIDPTPVLKSFRYNRELRGVTFGVNAVVTQGMGHTIRVGDTVDILD